jgi:hypothetical protein
MGAKYRSKTNLLNRFIFYFWRLFARLASKFEKSTYMTEKKIFEYIKKGIKNAEFHADFKSVERVFF